jgi:transcriptional regulator with PAS, ATPase and Fis domain
MMRRARSATAIKAKFPYIIAEAPAMIEVLDEAAQLAESDFDMLIMGESGVGKELLAHGMYKLSRRASGPFAPINVSALPETMIESELFGYEKGAFTGAHERRLGRFEQADQGVLFLDELGHLPPALQPKLLRALENKSFHRLGGKLIRVDVRILAATDKDLQELVAAGRFEKSLYFRFPARISIPPLRERPADIPALIGHFLPAYNRKHSKSVISVSSEALAYLRQHPWPGNVRQLLSALEGTIFMGDAEKHVLELDDFKRLLVDWDDWPRSPASGAAPTEFDHLTFDQIRERVIRRRLEIYKGNRTKAAKSLGVSRATFRSWCEQFGIESEE